MVIPYTVLDTYKWPPKGRYAKIIGEDLTAYTESLGLVPLNSELIQRNANPAWQDYGRHAEVRMTAEPQSEGTSWHQDGDTTLPHSGMNFALVLWANRDHTQFMADENIFQPDNFEIVIAKNLDAMHRRPPGLEGRRFHFRQRVELPEWL